MFGNFKRLTESVQALTTEVRAIREALDDRPVGENLKERVEALEVGVSQRIAEAEALVMQAESKFKAARSAEERARHQADRAERIQAELAEGDEEGMDPFEAAGKAWQLHQGDGEGGPEEGVQPVRPGLEVAPSPEQIAAARKFGG